MKHKIIKQYLKIYLCVLVFLILILNIISSQSISFIYFKFVNNDKPLTIAFLQKIKTLPEYEKILEMNNNIYGSTVKAEIIRQENTKKDLINNLKQQLTINPKARDVLYSLYQLNLAEGNTTKANNYLRQARKVDPNLNFEN
ncbi:hypothetical protein COS77_03425 [Candidatus Roizmanbacteria bacterium CG06_land_8_20_14_3_00_34_14]|uniref:Uncharacterized protein n=2 Tax=Candidatus Roizmaniibacteriota TaxID=1752723 RepID=A0A2M7AU03_9BACT|nr:MAG: hypothetical protein COT02_01825 [Candidatus Roizmanbacteria bacterium CG07_land_8_20_14_0_80_34_15]PIU74087.1 MAG: hypothetical protein COS77_03425 [Candidatus Roizmanbacteria bacterium CG06_land_8_20_14_3_00_34_14]